ncbi:thioredoxin fold domain-containing protein [Citrobacter freundii]|uniref:thioredoxin fold domain-containing protein n=1 Tax=Citrobacter freundii TaxID=546 RepID=UPI0023B1F230|nr:thioredoxin fold domain-containing protein [Citrobacter freundii]
MSQKSTYTTFRCNDFIYDTIVVLHQSGDGDPQALLIFREPQRMAIHDKKLIAFYELSKEAVTLLDDPMHDAAEVFNTIALQLKTQSKAVIKRRIKALVLFVGGALIASSLWFMGTSNHTSLNFSSTELTIPEGPAPVQPQQSAVIQGQPKMTVLPSTDNTVSHAVQAESANMQNIMKESHESLPASPAEALQTAATPITPPTPVTTEATEQSARQKMVAILKRSADRGLFTIPLSTGHERTLYAFLDPTCAVCKSMEPAIEQLAQNYNVVIFPVSVVNDGGDAVDKIVPVLCEKDLTARALAWSDLFRPDAGMQVPGQATSQQVSSDCSVSAQAVVAVNDTGFRAFGFSGTPTVLTDTGIRLATGMLAAPDKIAHFMKITDPMTQEQVDRFVSSLSIQE